MSGLNAGGRVCITLNNKIYRPVAAVEIEPSSIEAEQMTNQDGTVQRTVKPKPFRVNLTIRDRKGLDINELMESCGFDCTVQEKDMGRRVLLTNAFVEGTPTRNTENGEISGIQIVSSQYKVVEQAV